MYYDFAGENDEVIDLDLSKSNLSESNDSDSDEPSDTDSKHLTYHDQFKITNERRDLKLASIMARWNAHINEYKTAMPTDVMVHHIFPYASTSTKKVLTICSKSLNNYCEEMKSSYGLKANRGTYAQLKMADQIAELCTNKLHTVKESTLPGEYGLVARAQSFIDRLVVAVAAANKIIRAEKNMQTIEACPEAEFTTHSSASIKVKPRINPAHKKEDGTAYHLSDYTDILLFVPRDELFNADQIIRSHFNNSVVQSFSIVKNRLPWSDISRARQSRIVLVSDHTASANLKKCGFQNKKFRFIISCHSQARATFEAPWVLRKDGKLQYQQIIALVKGWIPPTRGIYLAHPFSKPTKDLYDDIVHMDEQIEEYPNVIRREIYADFDDIQIIRHVRGRKPTNCVLNLSEDIRNTLLEFDITTKRSDYTIRQIASSAGQYKNTCWYTGCNVVNCALEEHKPKNNPDACRVVYPHKHLMFVKIMRELLVKHRKVIWFCAWPRDINWSEYGVKAIVPGGKLENVMIQQFRDATEPTLLVLTHMNDLDSIKFNSSEINTVVYSLLVTWFEFIQMLKMFTSDNTTGGNTAINWYDVYYQYGGRTWFPRAFEPLNFPIYLRNARLTSRECYIEEGRVDVTSFNATPKLLSKLETLRPFINICRNQRKYYYLLPYNELTEKRTNEMDAYECWLKHRKEYDRAQDYFKSIDAVDTGMTKMLKWNQRVKKLCRTLIVNYTTYHNYKVAEASGLKSVIKYLLSLIAKKS